MNSVPATFDLIRKIFLFALLGVAVVFLAGPIGVVLGFAVVGFVVWFVLNLFVNGFRNTGESVRRLFRGLGRAVVGIFRLGGKAVVTTVTLPKHLVTIPQRIWHKGWSVGGNAFVWFFEIASGILLGALIGAIYDKNTGIREVAVLFGALTGAVLGVLVAHSRRKAHSEPLEAYPAD
ncbi:MAG: hypothetical protein ACJ8FY_28785 [Gemmataceae bacterium]